MLKITIVGIAQTLTGPLVYAPYDWLTVAKVRVGNHVLLTFDGLPGLEIPAVVKFIRPYGEKKRGDITYTVTIAPERWDERLRWNMTAQIAITH